MNFITNGPRAEIKQALRKSEHLFGRPGRITCLAMANVHLLGVVVKPLIYTALAVGEATLCVFYLLAGQFNQAKKLALAFGAHTACILVSPVGQFIQLIKALAGILNPHIYYKIPQSDVPLASPVASTEPVIPDPIRHFPEDELQKLTCELAIHISEIMESPDFPAEKRELMTTLMHYLTTTDHKERIDLYCRISNPAYKASLYNTFTEAYQTLCHFFKDSDFPFDKKLEVLKRLETERHQCVTGEAGLLADICSSLDEPVDITQKVPWLMARYKVETIKSVITEVHSTSNFIATYGHALNLPPSVIKAAKADLHVKESYASRYLYRYQASCTPEGCFNFIESYINADFPSRKSFRAHILNTLAEKVEDAAIDAAKEALLALHKQALEKEIALEQERHKDLPAEVWERTLANLKSKEHPYVDHNFYANYHFRLNPTDIEDSRLTPEAITLFIQEDLKNLHHYRT